jgi:hypothetical protein
MPARWPSNALLAVAALFLASPAARASEPAQGTQGSGRDAAATRAASTEQAKAALREMSQALASAKTVRFTVRNLVPMQVSGGDWITLVGTGHVMREGNDRLFVETGGDLYPFRYYFDGKSVTAFAPGPNVYARKDSPGTIDETLQRAARNGEAAFVFADLVSADPYAAMTKGLKSAVIVGVSTIDGVETRHVAVHGAKLDWEIWIGTEDRLPRMVTLTDVSNPRKPTHTVQLSDWALDQPLPADAFAFRAPDGSREIPFRDPAQFRSAARRPPPAPRR